jgi:hypothetical protein
MEFPKPMPKIGRISGFVSCTDIELAEPERRSEAIIGVVSENTS